MAAHETLDTWRAAAINGTSADPRFTVYFLMLVNTVLPSWSALQELLRHFLEDRPVQHSTADFGSLAEGVATMSNLRRVAPFSSAHPTQAGSGGPWCH